MKEFFIIFWLSDWLVGWLVAWLVGWLVWLIGMLLTFHPVVLGEGHHHPDEAGTTSEHDPLFPGGWLLTTIALGNPNLPRKETGKVGAGRNPIYTRVSGWKLVTIVSNLGLFHLFVGRKQPTYGPYGL